jgi:hypothetical protein
MKLNLLRLFEFYLAAMFVISSFRRYELYHAVIRLGVILARRYRKLFGKVREQSTALMTGSMLLPVIVTLGLWIMQAVLTRVIFPHAELTIREVAKHWWLVLAVVLPTLAVLTIDIYFLFRVGSIDAAQAEKYFHQAESWLDTWKATAVKTITFGKINPHQIVDQEVKKALDAGGRLIHTTLWWTVVQTAARVLLGLGLWLAWTFAG